jgi:hypothetical protein
MPDDLSVTTALVSCCSSAATACMQPQRGRSMQWPAPEHGRGWVSAGGIGMHRAGQGRHTFSFGRFLSASGHVL